MGTRSVPMPLTCPEPNGTSMAPVVFESPTRAALADRSSAKLPCNSLHAVEIGLHRAGDAAII